MSPPYRPYPHVCGCGRDFSSALGLIDHRRAKHGGIDPGGSGCPYCAGKAVFLPSSATLYRGRDWGPVWACLPCEAWVGCHPGTAMPLGRLADRELRQAKSDVHREFDPIWKRGYAPRREAYAQMAVMLGVPVWECHVGMFDLDLCRRAVAACQELGPRLRSAFLGRVEEGRE